MSVISVSSDSTPSMKLQRVPVSWTSGSPHKENLASRDVPDSAQKVKEWMSSNLKEKPEENDTMICIRYDCKKNPTSPPKPPSCFTRTTSLFSYMEEGGAQALTMGVGRFNGASPLSPNSHKTELCTYLKLMKPGEKSSDNSSIESRRSSRRLKTRRFTKNKYLPLPPPNCYKNTTDFEESLREIIDEVKRKRQRRRKFKFAPRKFRKSLRHLRSLRSTSLAWNSAAILRKRKRAQRRPPPIPSPPPVVTADEINVDLRNFVDDMLELDKMSEEHRKSVIESRILASSCIENLMHNNNQNQEAQRAFKIFSDFSANKENTENLVKNLIIAEHDYCSIANHEQVEPVAATAAPAVLVAEEEEEEEEDDVECTECELTPEPLGDVQILPLNKEVQMKSLQRSLMANNRRKLYTAPCDNNNKINHAISVEKDDGIILRAFYQNYHFVLVQEDKVSFWMQSALGNVLGAQNMWIPKGHTSRIRLNGTYMEKKTQEMVITSSETSVAYVELWTKEHKSEYREVPMADVFAIVYFWRLRQNGVDKKALQLENIQGSTEDVQYVVLKYYSRIIVSWFSGHDEKQTKIHSYHLASDFQTVANIAEMQPVQHYVESLHNIEDCDNLIMGCGETRITLWNIEYGYIVTSIELSTIKPPLATLWVKCDRGFLFTVQECMQELRLIAINGMNHSWKKLQNFTPIEGYDNLKGVCIQNGMLIACYKQGILCWNAQTGALLEEYPSDSPKMVCGKFVITLVDNGKILMRNALSHLISGEDYY